MLLYLKQIYKSMKAKGYINTMREPAKNEDRSYKIGKILGLIIWLSLMGMYLFALANQVPHQ